MIYRNIYFKEGINIHGTGKGIIYFTDHMYSFVNKMPADFDGKKDLYISCTKCSLKDFKLISKKIKTFY